MELGRRMLLNAKPVKIFMLVCVGTKAFLVNIERFIKVHLYSKKWLESLIEKHQIEKRCRTISGYM